MRKEITARAVMNKKIKILEIDIDGNNTKIYDVDKENNRIQKAIRARKQKDRKYREFSSRPIEMKNLKTDIRIKIDAFKQIVSHINEGKDEAKIKNKQMK